MELCQSGSIDINPKDLRTSLFTDKGTESIPPSPGFPITVTERLQLPPGWNSGANEWQLEDPLSTRLMVKLLLWGYKETFAHHWPLLADADQLLEISSQKWFTAGWSLVFNFFLFYPEQYKESQSEGTEIFKFKC